MKTTSIAIIASLIAGQAFAVTTWVTQSDANNSNATISTADVYSSNFGISFTTGPAGPFSMDWLTVALNTSVVTSGSASFKLALRNTTNTTEYSAVAGTTEFAMDLVNFSMPVTTNTNFNLELDATDIPNLSSYAMAANTTYALIVYNASASIGLQRRTGYANGTTNDFYTTSDGFAVINTFRNNSGNYTNTTNSYPTLGFSFGENDSVSAIPEPGQSVGLAAILGSALMLRKRRQRFAQRTC